MKKTINDIIRFDLPIFFHDNGDLVVMEGLTHFQFSISRVFTVRAPIGSIRGQHAHKQCQQMLVCTNGSVTVDCDDSESHRSFILNKSNSALIIPPGIWATQKYNKQNSILTVLCDRKYEEEDYIREYSEFLKFKTNNRRND